MNLLNTITTTVKIHTTRGDWYYTNQGNFTDNGMKEITHGVYNNYCSYMLYNIRTYTYSMITSQVALSTFVPAVVVCFISIAKVCGFYQAISVDIFSYLS